MAVALVLIAVAAPTAFAQDTGLEEYQEGVPTPGGEASTDNLGPGGSSGSGSVEGTTIPGAPGSEAAAGAGASGSQAGVAGGGTARAQLPATGSESLYLAIVGIGLVVGGLFVRRRLATD